MASKPKKNRSARDKQLERQRAQRQARKLQSLSPLQRLQPPFKLYEEWFHVGDYAKDAIVHSARFDDRLDDTAKDLADAFVRLGPRYHGVVPKAAVFLDQQIQEGVIHMAVPGEPGSYQDVPLIEMAAGVSSPDTQEELRRLRPDEMPEDSMPMTDEGAAMALHELHALGYLIVDDDFVVNVAFPPKTPGGKWWLNGQAER
ncbi:hypothetical protein [Streptosporangium lutulentum]|uniref:Uncharacterized protein n=1 Tax=Streptosporangium lutulentum TaxID=1461250 RepID=A0ABT9Q947_9ACTN|nr:hypothetical protein [Streptosporangium lutulentum]MDP9843282.1 hypothetical protein [Streptosporangium lutulentum]